MINSKKNEIIEFWAFLNLEPWLILWLSLSKLFSGIDETCTTCQSNHTELNLHRVKCSSIQTQHEALVELLRQFSSELRTDSENPELEDQLSNFGSGKSVVEYIRVLIKQSQVNSVYLQFEKLTFDRKIINN